MEYVSAGGNPDLLRQVLALSKPAKSTVGFLPDAAFAEGAADGCLIVALEGEAVRGYALFDLPRQEIRLVQLVVDPPHRGRSIARKLIEEIQARNPDRRGIVLHCRNDFEAHAVWGRLGFEAVGERIGRSFDGKPLTRWWRTFGQPDLLSLLASADSRPIAMLDACVFFEIVEVPDGAHASQLTSDWLGEHVRLGAGPQLWAEINRGNPAPLRQKKRRAAEPLRVDGLKEDTWKASLAELRTELGEIPPNDEDDLSHLAQSIAAGATWLVTEDPKFRARYSEIARNHRLRLVSVTEFIRNVDERSRQGDYEPALLADTEVVRRAATSSDLGSLAHRFVEHRAQEKIRTLRSRLDELVLADASHRIDVLEVAGEPRALIATHQADKALTVPLLRVTRGPGEATLARHLLGDLREASIEGGAKMITISDQAISPEILRVLPSEGFNSVESGQPQAYPVDGMGTLAELAHQLGDAVVPGDSSRQAAWTDLLQRATDAERWFAPYRVIGSDIPTYLVPIRAPWATALFDSRLSESQLFDRPWSLGLRRELIYYCSSKGRRPIAPGRIVWYVSGGKTNPPGSRQIRAVSSLTEVITGPPRQLHRRFRRLGVYSQEQVEAIPRQKGADVMALRFENTQLLSEPIPLDAFRRLANDVGEKVFLRSIHPVPEHLFASIISYRTHDLY